MPFGAGKGTLADKTTASGRYTVTTVDAIVAFVIFLMIKAINHFRRRAEKEPPAAPPPREVQLLEEIRDLLKKK